MLLTLVKMDGVPHAAKKLLQHLFTQKLTLGSIQSRLSVLSLQVFRFPPCQKRQLVRRKSCSVLRVVDVQQMSRLLCTLKRGIYIA